MKTLIMICIVAAFLSGCEEETVYREPKIYNYMIYISGGRITKFDYINGDTVSSRTEYLFEDSIVTKTRTHLASNSVSSTIFKMGQNGYAKSSVKTSEEYHIQANSDTLYTSRLYYSYDAENHLKEKAYEIIHEGEILIAEFLGYNYKDGNLISESHIGQFTVIPSPPSSNCNNTFVPSNIPCKLDIYDFTNGILGVTSRSLIEHVDYLDGCCWGGINASSTDFTYVLDNKGYVIQMKELTKECFHGEWSNTIYTKISNYELHFND